MSATCFPRPPGDPRLAPGYTGADDLDGEAADLPLFPTQWEIGLGRARVLSALGREEASDRWVSGDTGPTSSMAKAAPATCASCGWLLAIGGPLGQGFGLCANEMSPADGRAVALEYGCGAHSEVDAEPAAAVVIETIVDDLGFESVDREPLPTLAEDGSSSSSDETAESLAAGGAVVDVAADDGEGVVEVGSDSDADDLPQAQEPGQDESEPGNESDAVGAEPDEDDAAR